jgi:hypothetical protein
MLQRLCMFNAVLNWLTGPRHSHTAQAFLCMYAGGAASHRAGQERFLCMWHVRNLQVKYTHLGGCVLAMRDTRIVDGHQFYSIKLLHINAINGSKVASAAFRPYCQDQDKRKHRRHANVTGCSSTPNLHLFYNPCCDVYCQFASRTMLTVGLRARQYERLTVSVAYNITSYLFKCKMASSPSHSFCIVHSSIVHNW